MESTDARRAFPCWDEPELKATFEITLMVDDALAAFSNGSVVEEVPEPEGRRRVRFAPTMVMSTYLVAFIVGPLEATDPIDVNGVPLRIVYPPGKAGLTPFALAVGAHALSFFTDYFGIPYPADKLDLVAIPDFAFGAMENLGCVTFRESALLVDPAQAARVELERVADVVCHEIAHMWFGDLVTMKWWNGHLAQRGLRHLHGGAGRRRLPSRVAAVGELRRGAGGGHGRRRPPCHPPGGVPRGPARGGRGHVRRPHLPEGRQRPAHARAVPRARTSSARGSTTT